MGYFNFFDEWAMDPKVQSMSEPLQRRHAMLLCLRNIGDTSTTDDIEIATFMRITVRQALNTKAIFKAKGFIDGDGWNIKHWHERQSGHCESYNRVKKHRANKAMNGVTVTLQSNESNATETLRCNPPARADLLTNLLTNVTKDPPNPPGGGGAVEVSASPQNPESEVKRIAALAEKRWPFQEAGRQIEDMCETWDYRLVAEVADQCFVSSPKQFKSGWIRKGCQNQTHTGWKPKKGATPAHHETAHDPEKGRKAMEACQAAAEQSRLEGLARKGKTP